jgi:hypothetical protein
VVLLLSLNLSDGKAPGLSSTGWGIIFTSCAESLNEIIDKNKKINFFIIRGFSFSKVIIIDG